MSAVWHAKDKPFWRLTTHTHTNIHTCQTSNYIDRQSQKKTNRSRSQATVHRRMVQLTHMHCYMRYNCVVTSVLFDFVSSLKDERKRKTNEYFGRWSRKIVRFHLWNSILNSRNSNTRRSCRTKVWLINQMIICIIFVYANKMEKKTRDHMTSNSIFLTISMHSFAAIYLPMMTCNKLKKY